MSRGPTPERPPEPPSLEVPLFGDRPIDVHPGLVIACGSYTVLVSRDDGSMTGEGQEGLFDLDTRILSRHSLRLDGRRPTYVAGGTPLPDRWIGHLRIPLEGGHADGPRLPEDTLEVTLERRVGHGMAERIVVADHSMLPFAGVLTLELGADFIDAMDVSGRRQEGETAVEWAASVGQLTFTYRERRGDASFERALGVRVVASDSPVECRGTTLAFELELPARGRWTAELHYETSADGAWRRPPPFGADGDGWADTARDEARAAWHAGRTHVEARHHILAPAFERAADDLFALRNWELDAGPDAWVPHAGVPKYTGLFGRDVLTAAWQSLMVGTAMSRGALELVARSQGRERDDWRDEEPGKMIHEMRRGPLSALGVIPQGAYYGTQTTPALFVLLLSEYWHWTADRETLMRYRDPALRAFEWAARYGDRDGDGFLEYDTRSPEGLKNQAWKDSDEGIRYPDGRQVPNPISTVEEQAFHWLALERMAEVLLVLGEDDEAERFLADARALRQRWHEAFWMPEEGFYAMALDGEKRQVRSIGSNPGHALAVGIVPPEHARAVADRLLAPDLFSGWGVRTLSDEHPSYNPYGYHLGPVWPVENATFALGFKRYGLEGHLERLLDGLVAAAGSFQGFRLPEALGGHPRRRHSLPTIYPDSCSPQAWSASAAIQLVQVMLGIYPFAAASLLMLVRPRLPSWLDEIVVRDLHVGGATVSLRFERDADGETSFRVLEQEGSLRVLEVPPPQDVSGQGGPWLGELGTWLLDHAPGVTARTMRLAIGRLDRD